MILLKIFRSCFWQSDPVFGAEPGESKYFISDIRVQAEVFYKSIVFGKILQ